MKKLLYISTVIMLMFTLSGCSLFFSLPGYFAEPRFTDFDQYESDFTAVANFLANYYIGNQFNERITVDFSNGAMFLDADFIGRHNDIAVSADDLFTAITTVENQGFRYAWVAQDYVIFWEDETKYYGLLHSQTPQKAISEIRKWYTSMDAAKINSEWYEIGALHAI